VAGLRLAPGGGRRHLRWLSRLLPDPLGDQQQLADPGEHCPQRLRRCFLQAVSDLRDAHIDRSPSAYPDLAGVAARRDYSDRARTCGQAPLG
jgi:hypothetical protein